MRNQYLPFVLANCFSLLGFAVASAREPAQLGPNERIDAKDGTTEVWVTGGEFVMGVDDPDHQQRPDERPPHRVTVDGFWMDKTEVTNAAFVAGFNKLLKSKPIKDRFRTITRSMLMWPDVGYGQDMKTGELRVIPGHERWPVLVTWQMAQLYCETVSKQLPSEAQWEWAARGPDGRRYPWGNDWDPKKANVGTKQPAPVGSHPGDVSPFGILDMGGNVREYCWDKYERDYYSKSPAKNPLSYAGTWMTNMRAIRGGGYGVTEWDSRTTSRGCMLQIDTALCAGFRCVCGDSSPKVAKVESNNEPYLHAIPYMQPPVLQANRNNLSILKQNIGLSRQ